MKRFTYKVNSILILLLKGQAFLSVLRRTNAAIVSKPLETPKQNWRGDDLLRNKRGCYAHSVVREFATKQERERRNVKEEGEK